MNKAVFIGFQETDKFDIPLFNVEWPGNELDGSTVCVSTVNKLKIRELVDKAGNRLLAVPLPPK